MDVATLGLAVKAQEIDRANRSLDQLSGSAKKAETSARGIGAGATDAARKTVAANDNAIKSTRRLGGAFDAAKRNVVAFGAAAAASIVAAFSVRPVFQFKDALAEVSTLVNTATFDMRKLEKAALAQAKQFGGGATAQAKAFYQIISAGATSAAQATDTLTAANKLAIGGVTDIRTAADGLTSVLNAYGKRVEGATAVSDAMFVGMRAGKTTIGELSGALGRVAPLAAQTGVHFDELVASVAALTKGGISTNEAITGVRAILAAIAKPTSEATKLAAQLGIEFNSAALESKGLAGFLEDLIAKTGGSTDVLAQLFGGVEALVPIMALSGEAGDAFTDIMEQMRVKAGATEEAFNKMANSPGFQAGRLWSALQAEVLKSADALATMLIPAMRFLADHMENIVRVAKIVGAGLIVAFGPAILAAIVTLTTAIGTGLVAAFNMLTAAMMRNPFGALAVALTVVITAIWQFRDEFQQATGVDVVNIAKTAANTIVNSFTAGYEIISTLWRNFPDIMAAAAIGAANAAIAGMESMINRATVLLNDFIGNVNAALAMIPGVDTQIGTVEPVSLGRIQNDAAGRVQQETEALSGRVGEIMDRDLFGEFGSQVETSTPKVTDFAAAINEANTNLGELSGGAGGGLGGAAGAAKDALGEVATAAKDAGQAALDFSKDLVKGFVNDLRSGLEQGKGFWRSFADAGIAAMNKIGDKLVDLGIDMMFSGLTGGGAGGASTGGGIFGMIGSLFGFRDGGHPGGMVRGPGTSTSDSILTMLSNGPALVSDTEYIVNARQTAKFLPLLEAINDNDLPGFYAGGDAGGGGYTGGGPTGGGGGYADTGGGLIGGGGSDSLGSSTGSDSLGSSGTGGMGDSGMGGSGGLTGGAGSGSLGSAMGSDSLGGSGGLMGGAGSGSLGSASGGFGDLGGMGGTGGMGGFGGFGGFGDFGGVTGNADVPGLGESGTFGTLGSASGFSGTSSDFGVTGNADTANSAFGSPTGAASNAMSLGAATDFGTSDTGGIMGFASSMANSLASSISGQFATASDAVMGVLGQAIAANTGLFDNMATAISGFPSNVFGQDVDQAGQPRGQSTVAMDAPSVVGTKADFGDLSAIASVVGQKSDFDMHSVTGRNTASAPVATADFAKALDDAMTAIATTAPSSDPFGFTSSATATSPSTPSVSPPGTPNSPLAGYDADIDKAFDLLGQANAWAQGHNSILGFQIGRIGGAGGGDWSDWLNGQVLADPRQFSEGGFAGFFAKGGRIPAGQWGIAGENGPEPVTGPATILPNSAMGGGDAPVVNLRGGDIIIQGNADKETLPMIRREIAASEARMQKDLANNLGQYQGLWSTFKSA